MAGPAAGAGVVGGGDLPVADVRRGLRRADRRLGRDGPPRRNRAAALRRNDGHPRGGRGNRHGNQRDVDSMAGDGHAVSRPSHPRGGAGPAAGISGLCSGLCLHRFPRSSRHRAIPAARPDGLGPARLLVPRDPVGRRRGGHADLRALPLRLPAGAGGVLLALMETLADYGTVAYFGVQTFATGIYVSWFGLFDRPAAAQLALCLLVVALILATLERRQRRFQRHHDAGRRFERMEPVQLRGRVAFGAIAACTLPVIFGFLLPGAVLLHLASGAEQILFTPRYLGFLQHSLTLSGIAALLTVGAAIALGFNVRLRPSRGAQTAMRIAGIGYAVPGGVIAVGILFPFAAFDNALDAVMEANFGIDTGLLITGSIWLMIAAYMVRFMAVALNTYEAGLATVNTNIDAVARTLGHGPVPMLRRVHVPILRPSILTALLIVFVDVMKELPATLILRPFNYDTLAVQAHRLASDERLAEAAVPSLVIVAVGLLPVALLCWSLGREGRPTREAVIATEAQASGPR